MTGTLDRRVARLEQTASGKSWVIFGHVPDHWSDEDGERELRRLAQEAGFYHDAGVVRLHGHGRQNAELHWLGDLHVLVESVAKYSGRIGRAVQ